MSGLETRHRTYARATANLETTEDAPQEELLTLEQQVVGILHTTEKNSRMATISEKYLDFVHEPMEDKPVTALPGIGETLGQNLRARGFIRASAVLGQFLQRDPEKFKTWLKKAIGANAYQANCCTRALEEWCDIFL
ncbi:barrier-to-autointegration factor-like isoform X1 [Cololabis saira]|uniref:barrier-to-autointegration factor-like isoform X1 n=1 Tax=Cololabis saira TaxID=129043 RepID=UPI002AD4D1C5|nr:barrier-to-autointegration factor-like isoform X1 [Cololabis saira]